MYGMACTHGGCYCDRGRRCACGRRMVTAEIRGGKPHETARLKGQSSLPSMGDLVSEREKGEQVSVRKEQSGVGRIWNARTLPESPSLITVFKRTLPSREEALEFGKISLNHGSWGLGRVCGRWRATVLDMPCMWADLWISIPTGTAPWINYPVALLKEQIARGNSRLHDRQVFTAIAPSCARWETLELVSKWLLPTNALLRLRNNIPLLREIHIYADSQGGYAGQNIFEFAPALKIVRVTEPRLYADDRNINWMLADYSPNYSDSFMWPADPPFEDIFPWDQLAHYESQCMDPYHFDALCQAENLVVCRATVVERRHVDWRPPTELVRFMLLQKLTLYAPGPLLDQLFLPALQDFFIEAPPRDFYHVVALVQRSQRSLRKFWTKSHPSPARILLTNPDIVELGSSAASRSAASSAAARTCATCARTPRSRSSRTSARSVSTTRRRTSSWHAVADVVQDGARAAVLHRVRAARACDGAAGARGAVQAGARALACARPLGVRLMLAHSGHFFDFYKQPTVYSDGFHLRTLIRTSRSTFSVERVRSENEIPSLAIIQMAAREYQGVVA
ncbi:hypothetical protein FB451DRAFT_1370659 [Mycena latifolia]|nr:hypothetical protein FB451DRAFT_1370659 [Mycena latifolia]